MGIGRGLPVIQRSNGALAHHTPGFLITELQTKLSSALTRFRTTDLKLLKVGFVWSRKPGFIYFHKKKALLTRFY